jgi:hypothetical protein
LLFIIFHWRAQESTPCTVSGTKTDRWCRPLTKATACRTYRRRG